MKLCKNKSMEHSLSAKKRNMVQQWDIFSRHLKSLMSFTKRVNKVDVYKTGPCKSLV